ncbi:dapB [Symbiodinium sp. KB8]|nr:dapB [Symbiodinium sp. KB8]
MGKVIHDLLNARGHQVSFIIDQENRHQLDELSPENTDVAIEFSRPESAFVNITACLKKGVKVVSGTTGWLDHLPEIESLVSETDGTFFYASNYSLGVNLFFKLNKKLAELMENHDYEVGMTEIHHTEKLDQPSGTAITLAEGILEENQSKSNWINEESTDKTKLSIISERKPNVPGTHTVSYTSAEDTIEITHTANSRKGFALGAVKVAEWIKDHRGMLGMDDFLKI